MLLIFLPSIAIVLPAFRNVPNGAVTDHDAEERRIEPGEGAVKTGNQSPREGEKHITTVVNLARDPIPSIS